MTTLTYTTPAGQRIEFDYNHGHFTEVRTVFGQFTRKAPAVMGTAGTWILFKSERAARGYLSSIGLEDTIEPEVGPTWSQGNDRRAIRATDLLKAVDDDPVPAPPPPPAPGDPVPVQAPAQAPEEPSLPATWQQAYIVTPEQDEHGRWAFHVYYVGCIGQDNVRLTHTGYDRASLAERVAEMRFKLRLDEPNSASRRYLATHFNDTLKQLEG